MAFSFTYLPYNKTNSFSRIVTDYLGGDKDLQSFYTFSADAKGIKKAMEARKQFPVDRKLLVDTVTKQYESIICNEAVQYNLKLLLNENTFTVCTAHQPNLLTGYLYFIYKIVHAIKLANELKLHHPEYNFVPVYYMGSEDNDLEELGTFRYGDKKFVWDGGGQTGAVGRMSTQSLEPVLNELFKLLGPPGEHSDKLKELITSAYLQHNTIGSATQYLVNELFGRYGLIVLNADDRLLKHAFVPVMRDDLQNNTAHSIASAKIKEHEVKYKVQAHPRPINLFYLKDNFRERIEKAPVIARNEATKFKIQNSNLSFSEKELIEELNSYPERFSPNVILRPLLQETILPNIAFIGGGAEVSYWLQLKSLFEHYNVFYPPVILRQSILWIEPKPSKRRTEFEFSIEDLFKEEAALTRQYLSAYSKDVWQLTEEMAAMENIFASIKVKALAIDATLLASSEAALAKMKRRLEALENKMLRAEKRKMNDATTRIAKLKNTLFPFNKLQERVENFMNWYIQYGSRYTDILHDAIQPLKNEFLVIEHKTAEKA